MAMHKGSDCFTLLGDPQSLEQEKEQEIPILALQWKQPHFPDNLSSFHRGTNQQPAQTHPTPCRFHCFFPLYFLLFTLLQMSPFPNSFAHLHPCPASFPLAVTTPLSMSMGHAYMFFGSSLHLLSSGPPVTSPLTTVSLFHVSMPLFLFCPIILFFRFCI